jgi:hypothetical protein
MPSCHVTVIKNEGIDVNWYDRASILALITLHANRIHRLCFVFIVVHSFISKTERCLYVGVQPKCLLCLSDLNQTWIRHADLNKNPHLKISLKSAQW